MDALANLRKTPASLMGVRTNSSLGRKVKISPSYPLKAQASYMEALNSLRKTPATLMEALVNSSLDRRVKISPSQPLKAQACLGEG